MPITWISAWTSLHRHHQTPSHGQSSWWP